MKLSQEFDMEYVLKQKNGESINDPYGVKHKGLPDYVNKWVTIEIKKGLSPLMYRHQSFEQLELS